MTRRPTIAEVQEAVAAHFKLPLSAMTSETRQRAIAWPRQAAMAVALRTTGRSCVVVGRHFGGRDHTTVLFARDQVATRRAADNDLDKRLRRIEAQLTDGPGPASDDPVQLAFLDGPLFDRAAVPA